MSFPSPRIRIRRTHRFYPVLLALTLISISGGTPSAGWLDKLKDQLGSRGEKERSLSTAEVGGGLKDALRVGTETVIANLGKNNGFNLDPQIHIPLPGQLDQVRNILGKVGMGSMLTDLELRLNRAAEIAVPKARQLFLQAINDMTIEDVMTIYKGPDDSATQYFKSKMSVPLALEMKPVIDESLVDVGAVKAYDDLMKRYNSVPFAPKVEADLSDYVVQKGMDGIFFYLAKEEAAIRQNPAKRTTDLLKRVFGN